jgi:hypothetical protein
MSLGHEMKQVIFDTMAFWVTMYENENHDRFLGTFRTTVPITIGMKVMFANDIDKKCYKVLVKDVTLKIGTGLQNNVNCVCEVLEEIKIY